MAVQTNQANPAQSANLFAQMTRQNYQPLPAVAGAENATVTFDLPKVRLTSRIRIMFEAVVNVVHASQTSYVPAPMAPYTLIRRIGIDMNNGFSPFSVSGKELYMYSLIRQHASILTPATSGRGKVVQGLTAAASTGADNTVRFVVDLPLTVNDRDPVGLILTQNQETTVTVSIDVDTVGKLLNSTSGFTTTLKSLSIQPMVESFSIPAVQEAFPDLSVLKLVQSTRQTISGAGEQTLKLPVGTTYRKLALYIEDANGGVADTAISGNIEMIFNTADYPYRVTPKMLAAINHEQFGTTLPAGLYVFDFSFQGISGYGGARDYVDTERLTEMWIKFNASAAGTVTAVYEQLSRLRTGR